MISLLPGRKPKGTIFALLLIVPLIVAPLFSLIGTTYAPPPWWNSSWNFRKLLLIDHSVTTADLTNFPMLIDILDIDLKNKAQADGDDIVFVYLETQLNHEIESYDYSTGHLVAWVNIPLLLATTDTEICMYYGNPSATNQENVAQTWDSDYVMVQHLDETSGTRFDSTSNGNDAATSGTVTKSISGQIDGADNFGGIGYEEISQDFLPASSITVEFWLRPTSYSSTIWTKFINTGPTTTRGISGGQTSKAADRWYMSLTWDEGAQILNTGNIVSNYAWNYVAVTWNGTYSIAFLNQTQVNHAAISGTPDWSGKPLYLGSNYAGGEIINGAIDEVRISKIGRSSQWIMACYNAQRSPSSYWWVGSEETEISAPSILIFETPQNEASDIYTNPTVSVRVFNPSFSSMNITFTERIANQWVTIGHFENVPDGAYYVNATMMLNLATTYYWGVHVTDGSQSTSKTYSLTTTDKILQQKWSSDGLPSGASSVLCADINNDGIDDVIRVGGNGVVALNGSDGTKLWNYTDPINVIGDFSQPQMADLDNDGRLEIIVPIERPAGIMTLRSDGTKYWNVSGLGRETYSGPVIFDIFGDGHPIIFVGSTDTAKGLEGTGRITALSYDGRILNQTFAWRPCGGGLSIADTDFDGEFELYMGDRNMYLNSTEYGDNDYGKGLSSYWARNLTLRWYRPEIFCSSQKPMIADVNDDGILDVIIGDLNGGIAVLNATDGSTIRMSQGIPLNAPTHYQPSVYDIDRDGNLEMLMADPHDTTSDDIVVWDLVKWQIDARIYLGKSFYGPMVADVTGDGLMEIVACNYRSIFIIDNKYRVIDGIVGLSGDSSSQGETPFVGELTVLAGTLNYAVVQDVDGDGYNELLVTTQSRSVYCFDTPSRRPDPRPRSEVQFYSEYRRGAAEYVQPQGGAAPVISLPNPVDHTAEVSLSLSKLEFTLTDYQRDPMNYTVVITPAVGSASGTNVGNGRYNVTLGGLTPYTTYRWTITCTDGVHVSSRIFTFTTESLAPWWNQDWMYRRKIAIQGTQITQDLTDFPVLVSFTDSSLIGKVMSNAYDIVFTDFEGNKLSHEIELYDNTIGRLVAWVKIPSLRAGSDFQLYMYYHNPLAPSQQNPVNVWDSNFVLVQHLEETTGIRYDSTINGNNAVPSGTVNKYVAGKIDGADVFTGSGYERVAGSFLPTSSITVELWLRPTAYSSTIWTKFVNTGPTTTRGISGGQSSKTSDLWYMMLTWDSGAKTFNTGSFTSGLNWNHLAITWDGAYCYAFLNGAKINEATISGTPDWIGRALNLASNYGGSELFNGAIDEVRISKIARSIGWIKTSYNNQANPSSFFTTGSEETIPQVPIVFAPSPKDKSVDISPSLSQLSFNITDSQNNPMTYIVKTSPNIGSGSGTGVTNGRYSITVSNLQYSIEYTWTVSVNDGTHWTNVTYTFTTLPSGKPTQDYPTLSLDASGNLICNNQTTYDPEGDRVTNIYNWYRNGISTTNLYMPFETNSSTIAKDYAGNNNGIVTRQATWVTNGIVGGAYRFDRGFIEIPGSSALDGGGAWSQITIEEWIYLTASQSNTRTIARIPSYEIGISGNKIFVSIWIKPGSASASGYNRITYGTPLLINTWYHVAATFNGSTLSLYLNGTLVVSEPTSISGMIQASGSNPMYIGWFDYFKGMIDEVRIYPKALSPQQIYQRYLETKNGLTRQSKIVSQETQNGDVWTCAVTPNDSHQDGTTLVSNAAIIGSNNLPIAKNLRITPTAPNTSNDLVGSYVYFDVEGSPESGTQIRWYKNTVLQPALNDQLIVPASLTTTGEIWYFTVLPKDGTAFGQLQKSPQVTITP